MTESHHETREEIFDIYLDTQYAVANCLSQDYAERPWEFAHDALNAYLSIRFSKRADFLAHLERSQQARIMHELDRIQQTRANFASDRHKIDLMEDLKTSRQKWRNEVIQNRFIYEQQIQRSGSWRGNERTRRDLGVLARFAAWPVASQEETESLPTPSPERFNGMKSSLVCFWRYRMEWRPLDFYHARCTGEFPNQKIPIEDILADSGDSPIRQRSSKDEIRWFHFPANNMVWIEKAMARYYGLHDELDGETSPLGSNLKEIEVLARQFWRGQMLPSDGQKLPMNRAIHARRMRPSCSIIPRHRGGALATDYASQNDQHNTVPHHDIAIFLPYMHWETSSRRARMAKIISEGSSPRRYRRRFSEIALAFNKAHRSALGHYLMTVAQVSDQMDCAADEKLLRENLEADPPVHFRRTLDQYYFSTMEDTSKRDRDQVVYRGTRANRASYKTNTRVVMIDQLWLWILDDNTIITAFPKHWGRNKSDASDVHRSIRRRLMQGRPIQSIHQLAFLIIDQCSLVFFDRSTPLDERPEVLEIFQTAIASLAELSSVASDSFWRNLPLLSRQGELYHSRKLIGFGPEVILLRESQDIIEELRIMMRLYGEQLKVVRDLWRHLGQQVDSLEPVVRHLPIKPPELGREGQGRSSSSPDNPHGQLRKEVSEAETLIQEIQIRQAELQELEDSGMRVAKQIEGLLVFKQQQVSTIEVQRALHSAAREEESLRQEKAITAFTIVTIFFLPLNFFAAFFGMNNDRTGQDWMTLTEQVKWMFGLSAIVIAVSIALAFSSWLHVVVEVCSRWLRMWRRGLLGY